MSAYAPFIDTVTPWGEWNCAFVPNPLASPETPDVPAIVVTLTVDRTIWRRTFAQDSVTKTKVLSYEMLTPAGD